MKYFQNNNDSQDNNNTGKSINFTLISGPSFHLKLTDLMVIIIVLNQFALEKQNNNNWLWHPKNTEIWEMKWKQKSVD